eukprot:620719-Amphidinium_carterae.1
MHSAPVLHVGWMNPERNSSKSTEAARDPSPPNENGTFCTFLVGASTDKDRGSTLSLLQTILQLRVRMSGRSRNSMAALAAIRQHTSLALQQALCARCDIGCIEAKLVQASATRG